MRASYLICSDACVGCNIQCVSDCVVHGNSLIFSVYTCFVLSSHVCFANLVHCTGQVSLLLRHLYVQNMYVCQCLESMLYKHYTTSPFQFVSDRISCYY